VCGRRWGCWARTLAASWLLPDPLGASPCWRCSVVAGFEARDAARRGWPRAVSPGGRGGGTDAEMAWFRLMQQRPDLVRTAP
jgi:hypothetical protein